MRFEKKVVVITGASSGLGRQLSIDFAREGASVILFSRNEEKLLETFNMLDSQSSSLVIGDVTDIEKCYQLAEYTFNKYGRIDYLVMNAGLSMWAEFDKIDNIGAFKNLFEVNFWGVVNSFKAFSKHLHSSKGMAIFISSAQGKFGVPYHTIYSASKHAVQGFINSLRFEFKDIHLLSVLPHWVSGTELRENALNSAGEKIHDQKKSHTSESVTVQECSKRILSAAFKKKHELIMPFKLKMLMWLYSLNQRLAEKIIRSKVHSQ